MSVTTKTIGFVIKQRGEYVSNPETRYYKDNVVQYHDSSYIANPIDYDAEENPLAYVTSAPVNNEGVLNEGWKIFASGNNTFSTGEKVTEIGIDDKPTVGSNSLVKSGGVQNELTLGAVYDVSAKNPTAGPNNDGKWESLSALLSDASLNTLIPTAVRRGGMSIKYVQTSDNKYVQWRLVSDDWSINTEDWAITDEGVYVENPEFVYVKTDSKDKILWAIKTDGSIYYGAGVPQQVIDYINEKIADLSLDEYEDIVTFLGNLIEGDKTLQQLLTESLATKVDKVTGKSLIDAEYASTKSTIDNPEFLDVTLDANDKILEGIQVDGTKIVSGDFNVGGSAKILGEMEVSGVLCKVIENPEYLAAWVDAEDRIIFGFKTDGKTYVGDADFLDDIESIKAFLANFSDKNIDWDALTSITATENPEYIEATTDSEGKLIAGRTPDGAAFENVGFTTPKVSIGGHIIENIKDPEGRSEITTDIEGKIISYRDSNGVKHEEVGIETDSASINHLNLTNTGMTEFQQALKDSGFNPGGCSDWSDAKSIEIPVPRCAIANITNNNGDATWPTTKLTNAKYYLEFWDMQGNYFKKEIIFNAQGNSSMAFIKKNGAADFCNNNGWDDEDTFSIKFGDWVAQDSFHFKAYYTDYIKGSCIVAYQISEAVYKTRGVYADVPWKKALIDFSEIGTTTPAGLSKDGIKDVSLQIDNGARCMPDGFPCIFYLNGEFYGIYSWQLKKHRDNYHFDKANPSHIQLDGTLYTSYLWGGSIDWTQFEMRNPKNLVYATAHGGSYKYDADVAQAEIAGNSDGSTSYDTWEAGTYPVGKIVEHNGHLFINTVANNDAEPIYHNKNNSDTSPDFKNKTECNWINCTNTVKVKEAIINLSKRVGEINTLNETDSVAAKELFDTYFDADNIIDYQLIGMAVNDPDGFGKNWQWVTYDGIKWYVCQYDKDMSFGNHWTGMFTRPASSGWCSSSTALPTGLALRYYLNEHVARWKELVELGIFTVDFFEKKINEWIARIGQSNFKNEWKKWSEASCNRDSLIDFENWHFTGGYNSGTPSGNIWNEETQYSSGQYVWFRCGTSSEYLQFRAQSNNVGKPCLTSLYTTYPTAMGYRDSVWRYFKFIEAQLEAQNNFINNLNV